MGRRGPSPEPLEIKKAKGNPSKERLPEADVMLVPIINLVPPPYLKAEAKKEWRRVAEIFNQMNMLGELDRTALAAYCQAYANWVEVQRKIKKEGLIVDGPKGLPMTNPLIKISNMCMSQMLLWSREFGMTPSARMRVKPPANDLPQKDRFADLEKRYG